MGVSRDTVDSHREFARQHGILCPLIADPDGAICSMLGVLPDPAAYAKRTTFVVDKTGIIRRIFEGVKVAGHVDEVLAAVKLL